MKKVTLAQLKSDFFSSTAIIEGSVEINPHSISESCKKMNEVIVDLDGLREALFFKSEKIKRKMASYDRNKYTAIVRDIVAFISRISIPPLGDSQFILEKNRKILELKEIQKYLRYTIEINRSGSQVLEALLTTEIKENWVFLSNLIHYSLKNKREEHRELFLEYSKKMEEKMEDEFEKAVNANDCVRARTAFECLAQLDKEATLLDQYMLLIDFFKSDIETTPPLVNVINLDRFALKDNTFDRFIDRLIEALESNILKFYSIFGNTPKYNDYLFGKMYRMMVFRNLEQFLNISNPFLFLLCLKSAYMKLQELADVIRIRCPYFESDFYVNEGFSQYLAKAIQKEKQSFDEIFNILVHGAKSVNSYVLLNNPVVGEDSARRVYEKMLCVVHLMEERRSMFYTAQDEEEILKYFYRKMSVVIENVVIRSSGKMEAIGDMSFIYLITKKYFGSKVYLVRGFVEKLSEAMEEVFKEKFEESKGMIKRKIENLYFLKSEGHVACLNSVKSCISEAESLGGRNFTIYSTGILRETYFRLSKQVLLLVYSQTQCANMLRCLDDFVGYTTFLNNTSVVRQFSHLREIGKLISVGSDLFLSTYEEYKGSISEKELKDLVRCRKDKDTIKALLNK
ncbi:hypothetical protein PAEPH01_1030 [Pancytospora epiphaga]|nr:hypothetical protein PAEPH01_1030 [Pancytospora epiphaga]